MALVNHEGIWTPTTSAEILTNTPVCTACHGEGISSPGTSCKICHGTGHILSGKLAKLYSELCEKEYYAEEEERETDFSNEDLHMLA